MKYKSLAIFAAVIIIIFSMTSCSYMDDYINEIVQDMIFGEEYEYEKNTVTVIAAETERITETVSENVYETLPEFVNHINTYAYDCLNEKQQVLYRIMLDAVGGWTEEITVFPEELEAEDFFTVNKYLLIDRSDLFYVRENGTVTTTTFENSKWVSKYTFNYCMSLSEYKKHQIAVDAACEGYLRGIRADMNGYDKALAAYEFIIENTRYDERARDKITDNKYDKHTNTATAIYGVFSEKIAVCEGYAKAMQYLLEKVGIECVFVSGGNHAWNLVRLDGDWYYIDATWGDPVTDNGEDIVSYDYFCLTTKELLKTHTIGEHIPVPECTAVRYNYYVYNNLLLESYEYGNILNICVQALNEGKKEACIKFKTQAEYEIAMRKMFDENEVFKVLDGVKKSTGASIQTDAVKYRNDDDFYTVTVILQD